MQIAKANGQARNLGPYAYTLVEIVGPHARVRHADFPTLIALAKAAWTVAAKRTHASTSSGLDALPGDPLSARGPRCETFNIDELIAWGRRLKRHECLRATSPHQEQYRDPAYACRQGPVAGVHKGRGYVDWYRAPKAMNERRVNAVVICGEHDVVMVRSSRRSTNLPSERDDMFRCMQRCWKAQIKGCKSWDR